MNNLIEAIKQKQRQDGLSDTALALLLGIDRSTWAKIKSGQRNPGMKFLKAVSKKLMPVEISDTIATTPSQTAQDSRKGRFKTLWGGLVLRAKRIWQNSREP